MKIISSTQLKELDKYTIAKEPVASIDLMERAAEELTRAITHRWDTSFHIAVFAGPGNNGGDALAVARMLLTIFTHHTARLSRALGGKQAHSVINRLPSPTSQRRRKNY